MILFPILVPSEARLYSSSIDLFSSSSSSPVPASSRSVYRSVNFSRGRIQLQFSNNASILLFGACLCYRPSAETMSPAKGKSIAAMQPSPGPRPRAIKQVKSRETNAPSRKLTRTRSLLPRPAGVECRVELLGKPPPL